MDNEAAINRLIDAFPSEMPHEVSSALDAMMSKFIQKKLGTYTCIRPTQDEGWVVKSTSSNSVMLLTHDGSHRYQAHLDVVSPDASDTIYCWDDAFKETLQCPRYVDAHRPTDLVISSATRSQRVPLPSHDTAYVQHVALGLRTARAGSTRWILYARYKPCNDASCLFLRAGEGEWQSVGRTCIDAIIYHHEHTRSSPFDLVAVNDAVYVAQADFETIVFCDALGKTVFSASCPGVCVDFATHNATLFACFDTTALVRVDATTWAVTTHDLGCFAPFRGQAATVLAANCLHVAVGFTDGSVGLFDTALSCVHFVYTPEVYGLCKRFIEFKARDTRYLNYPLLYFGEPDHWTSALGHSVIGNNVRLACMLLQEGGMCTTMRSMLLHDAVGRGQVAMVKALLAHGTPMTNEALRKFSRLTTPQSSMPLFQLIMDELTAKGTKVITYKKLDACDALGRNLPERRPQLYVDIMEQLMQHNIDVPRDAIRVASEHVQLSDFLLSRMKENGADIECIRPYNNMTSAKLAAVRGHWAYVLRLVAHGAVSDYLVAHGAVSDYYTGETSYILSEAELSQPNPFIFYYLFDMHGVDVTKAPKWPTCYARHMDAHRALWSSKTHHLLVPPIRQAVWTTILCVHKTQCLAYDVLSIVFKWLDLSAQAWHTLCTSPNFWSEARNV